MPQHPFDSFALILHPSDDVAILKQPLKKGTQLFFPSEKGTGPIIAASDIPPAHKIALRHIPPNAPLRRYGQIIGFATSPIAPGDHVHSHNLTAGNFARDYAPCSDARPIHYHPPSHMRHFQGYLRPDARAGTRNYIAVISSVNCSATVCKYVADHFKTPDFARNYPNIDGILPITHKSGCTTPPGEAADLLRRVLAGFAKHPNIHSYVMIGLGCEGNQISTIRSRFNLDVLPPNSPPPTFINIQEAGGLRKTVHAAIAAVEKLLPLANAAHRTPQPLSKLVLATNCGGSDGNSGITANPALGLASDQLLRYHATSVLAETPEIYGAEHLLTRRAISPQVADKLLSFIRWWENHAKIFGATIDNNHSPGNKAGGLTTIYEKSLGAVAKAGQSPLAAVYAYAEQITSEGLCFMDTPGYDPVSMTGLVAGGCNLAAFTTGRGSVYGCKPTPCLKIATNTPLYNHMLDDMDLNAGTILDNSESLEQVATRILESLIAIASGQKTKSEQQGIGDEEFAPWTQGPTF